jgi:hypothetical protein
MITIDARCPGCEQLFRAALVAGAELVCPHCHQPLVRQVPDLQQNPLVRCLTCPSTELFVRKDFPQRLGVAIVVAGFVASSVTWYHHQVIATFGLLFATALIDVVLYLIMGNVLQCYRCHAQYRGLGEGEDHQGFDLETHERYRQQAARMPQSGPAQHSGR